MHKTILTLDYYREKKHDFIFDKCYSPNKKTGRWELTPRLPHIEDIITIYCECPKGAEVVSYKQRQVGWTWTIIKCIVHDMLMEISFTAYWHSIQEEHALDAIHRARGVVDHFDFLLPPDFTNFSSGAWNIYRKPTENHFGIDNQFIAFSKNPLNITGKCPDVYVADEVCKFDPPSLYEKLKREAKAAVRNAKFFKNSTTLHGNSFENEVKELAVIGMSYDQHIGTFKTPSQEEWVKAKNSYVARDSTIKNPET